MQTRDPIQILVNSVGMMQLADIYMLKQKRVNCRSIISSDLASLEVSLQPAFWVEIHMLSLSFITQIVLHNSILTLYIYFSCDMNDVATCRTAKFLNNKPREIRKNEGKLSTIQVRKYDSIFWGKSNFEMNRNEKI